MKPTNKKDTPRSLAHSRTGAIRQNQEGGSRSDLRTRVIINKILCDTLRPKLTSPLKFLWTSQVVSGQGSGSELVVGAVLGDTLSQRSPSLPPF